MLSCSLSSRGRPSLSCTAALSCTCTCIWNRRVAPNRNTNILSSVSFHCWSREETSSWEAGSVRSIVQRQRHRAESRRSVRHNESTNNGPTPGLTRHAFDKKRFRCAALWPNSDSLESSFQGACRERRRVQPCAAGSAWPQEPPGNQSHSLTTLTSRHHRHHHHHLLPAVIARAYGRTFLPSFHVIPNPPYISLIKAHTYQPLALPPAWPALSRPMSAATPTSPGFPLQMGSGAMAAQFGAPSSSAGSPRSRPTTPLSAAAFLPAGPTYDDLSRWEDADVAAWLTAARLGHHAATFAENDIRGSVLLDVDQAALKEMGITMIKDRVRIQAAIKLLNKRCADAALARRPSAVSLPPLSPLATHALYANEGEIEYLEHDHLADNSAHAMSPGFGPNSMGLRRGQMRPPPLTLKQSASRGMPGHPSPANNLNNGHGFGLSAARGLTPGAARGSVWNTASSSSTSSKPPTADGALHRKVNSIGGGAAPAIVGASSSSLSSARHLHGHGLHSTRPSTATGASGYSNPGGGSLQSRGGLTSNSPTAATFGGAAASINAGRPSTATGAQTYSGAGINATNSVVRDGYSPLTPSPSPTPTATHPQPRRASSSSSNSSSQQATRSGVGRLLRHNATAPRPFSPPPPPPPPMPSDASIAARATTSWLPSSPATHLPTHPPSKTSSAAPSSSSAKRTTPRASSTSATAATPTTSWHASSKSLANPPAPTATLPPPIRAPPATSSAQQRPGASLPPAQTVKTQRRSRTTSCSPSATRHSHTIRCANVASPSAGSPTICPVRTPAESPRDPAETS